MKKQIKKWIYGLMVSAAVVLAETPPAPTFTVQDGEPGVFDYSTKILPYGDNSYVLGYRETTLGKPAGSFLEKFDASGKRLWIKSVNLRAHNAALVPLGSISTGAIFIAGPHENSETRFYASRLDLDGKLVWQTELPIEGERNDNVIAGVTTDPRNSDVIVVGSTFGAIKGKKNIGFKDAFIFKLSATGTILWGWQFGSDQFEFAGGVACDQRGNIYTVGGTEGQINAGGPTTGTRMYLAKFGPDGNILPLENAAGRLVKEIREYYDLPLGGYGAGIVIKDDTLYITDELPKRGMVLGHKPLGDADLLVVTLDLNGVILKSMRVGTQLEDRNNVLHNGNNNITVDDKGAVYVSSHSAKFYEDKKDWYHTMNVFRWMPGDGSFDMRLELRAGFMATYLNSLAVDNRGKISIAGALSGNGELGRFFYRE